MLAASSRRHEPATEDDPGSDGPAQDCIALVPVTGGELEVVGDPEQPWACWPGDTREWSEPTPTDFEQPVGSERRAA